MIARLPRRDLFAILGALTATTLLCWWYLWDMAAGMQGMMEMPGMEMPGMEMPGMGIPVWDATYALAMFAMWAIMMVGMMLPSVAPTTLIYAGIVRKAREDGHVVASTGWFAAGYLLAWTGFSVLATALQWQLDRAALLSPMMARSGVVRSGS